MKPIIGIISRPVLSDEKNRMYGVYNEIMTAVWNGGGLPVGILPLEQNWREILDNCDGLIFQGGDESEEHEKKYLKYAYEQNIPTLGICLGMQLMGSLFEGILINVNNHKEKNKPYVHNILLERKSKLYSLLKEDIFLVNSRHKSAVSNTLLDVVAVSEDGVIEAIEDKTKKFFIGVQWHPESMSAYDKVASRLFDQFVKECEK